MANSNMHIGLQVVYVRVDVLHFYRNIIGPCIQLNLRGTREAEVRGCSVEVRRYRLVEVGGGSHEWFVSVELEVWDSRNDESQSDANTKIRRSVRQLLEEEHRQADVRNA